MLTGIRFSYMWALGSFSAPPGARGRSPGELWDVPRGHFGCNLDPLGRVWDHFWGNFWKVACPGSIRGVATCLLLKKHIVGTSKADRRRLSAHGRSIALENKIIGDELKITPLTSQTLARIFHGKHLGGAVLLGVGGRGRRPFQSADPGRGLGVRVC